MHIPPAAITVIANERIDILDVTVEENANGIGTEAPPAETLVAMTMTDPVDETETAMTIDAEAVVEIGEMTVGFPDRRLAEAQPLHGPESQPRI